jgi:hypothetical protein
MPNFQQPFSVPRLGESDSEARRQLQRGRHSLNRGDAYVEQNIRLAVTIRRIRKLNGPALAGFRVAGADVRIGP